MFSRMYPIKSSSKLRIQKAQRGLSDNLKFFFCIVVTNWPDLDLQSLLILFTKLNDWQNSLTNLYKFDSLSVFQ